MVFTGRAMLVDAGVPSFTLTLLEQALKLPPPTFKFAVSAGLNVCNDPPSVFVEMKETTTGIGFKHRFLGSDVGMQVPGAFEHVR
jgi:hypothetical protein